jgi:hypothetical protein
MFFIFQLSIVSPSGGWAFLRVASRNPYGCTGNLACRLLFLPARYAGRTGNVNRKI